MRGQALRTYMGLFISQMQLRYNWTIVWALEVATVSTVDVAFVLTAAGHCRRWSNSGVARHLDFAHGCCEAGLRGATQIPCLHSGLCVGGGFGTHLDGVHVETRGWRGAQREAGGVRVRSACAWRKSGPLCLVGPTPPETPLHHCTSLNPHILAAGRMRRPGLLLAALATAAAAVAAGAPAFAVTPAAPLEKPAFYPRKCGRGDPLRLCGVDARCGRYMEDDFLSPAEVSGLMDMMKVGFESSTIAAGPAILDVDTGYLRDTSLRNVYPAANFSAEQFTLYGSVFERIRVRLKQVFHLNQLYLTAPTFVARLRGGDDWQPTSPHDEYYHPHVDADNAPHYTFSGLVYLSTEGVDFTGGNFSFMTGIKEEEAGHEPSPHVVLSDIYGRVADTHVIAPRAGRLLLFSSSTENLHRVARVASGDRFTFSMWYTCDPKRQFKSFLNGKARGPLVLGEESGATTDEVVGVDAAGDVTPQGSKPKKSKKATKQPPRGKDDWDAPRTRRHTKNSINRL